MTLDIVPGVPGADGLRPVRARWAVRQFRPDPWLPADLGPALLNLKNVRGATPLHLAAINPDGSVMEALLAAGAEVNVGDEEGFTPLHMAAFHRQADYALLLLEAGADVEAGLAGRVDLPQRAAVLGALAVERGHARDQAGAVLGQGESRTAR